MLKKKKQCIKVETKTNKTCHSTVDHLKASSVNTIKQNNYIMSENTIHYTWLK